MQDRNTVKNWHLYPRENGIAVAYSHYQKHDRRMIERSRTGDSTTGSVFGLSTSHINARCRSDNTEQHLGMKSVLVGLYLAYKS